MKKVVLLLFIVCTIATGMGCSKSTGKGISATGTVLYGGEPAADGIGYYIRLSPNNEVIIPNNLPGVYKQFYIHKNVKIRFEYTGEKMSVMLVGSPGLSIIRLISIQDL